MIRLIEGVSRNLSEIVTRMCNALLVELPTIVQSGLF